MSQRTRSFRAHALGFALGALLGCRDEPPPELVKNSCITDLNCGNDELCEQDTLMCMRLRTVEPYRVVLQVQPESTSIEVPDAGGVTLVGQTAVEFGLFEGRVKNAQLKVPAAVRMLGRVQGQVEGENKLLEAELTLTPRMGQTQLRKTVVNSGQSALSIRDAGMDVNVEAQLNPSLTYDLRVQPLLTASKELPPHYSTEPYSPDTVLEVEYEEMVARNARLTSIDEKSWAKQHIRLQDKVTGRVMSSVTAVSEVDDAGVDGRFTLYAERNVFMERGKTNLVTELSGRYDVEGKDKIPRWQVTLELDGARFLPDAVITMPSVPELVAVEGTVTNLDTRGPLPNANLEFVSKFPVDEESASEANWCRLPSIPELACKARLSTTTDEHGHFSRMIVPGNYNVYVQPDRSSSPDRTTFATTVLAEHTPGFKPQSMEVKAATRYDGLVRSPQNQGMPNITVNAKALGVYEEDFEEDERALAQYNRSITAITNAHGEFSLYPDIGRYDFSIETPSESGFAWMFCPNYRIEPRDHPTPLRITLRPFYPPSPVYLAGTVEHEGVKLPNARVEAYAVWETEPSRLLLVARAVSDSEGNFQLSMPPQLPPPMPDEQQTCPIRLEAPAVEDLDAGLESMDSSVVTSDGEISAPDSAR